MNKPSKACGATADLDAALQPSIASHTQPQRSERPSAGLVGAARGGSLAARADRRARRSFKPSTLLELLLIAAACGLSAWHVGTYLVIVAQRLPYPYAIEWMESGTLEHVARVLEGKPLYVEPSLEFTPFIYTPLYYWVSAPFAWSFGLRLPSLRLVSFLASLGIFVLLFSIVWKRTRNPVAGVVTVGLFAAAFEVCGGFYDLARVDSLALFWLLLGIFLLREHGAWAGLCLAAAFLTKQSTAMVAVPLLATHCVTQTGTRRFYAAGIFGIITLGFCAIADSASGGAFRYYVFALPAQHPWYPAMRREFWRGDMFQNVPFACTAALYLLMERRSWRAQLGLWSVALGCVGAAWLMRLHTGGSVNVLMPLIAFLAWSLGEAQHRLSQPERTEVLGRPWQRGFGSARSLFGLGLCVAQLSWLLYERGPHLPSGPDRQAGDAVIAYLRKIEGPILAPFDPALARMAGRIGSAQEQAITDVGLGRDRKRNAALQADISRALIQQRYAAIVAGGEWHPQELRPGYVLGPARLALGFTKEGAPCGGSLEVWLRREKK